MGKIRAYIVFISAVFLIVEFCSPIISSTKNGGIDDRAQPSVQKTGSDKLPVLDSVRIRKAETFLMPFAADGGGADIIKDGEGYRHLPEFKQKGETEDKSEARKETGKGDEPSRQDGAAGTKRSIAFFRN